MIQNDFKRLESYTKDLEALRAYPRVKEERDSLVAKVTPLKREVAELNRQLRNETSTSKRLLSQLRRSERRLKRATSKLQRVEAELSALKGLKVKISDGQELSLDEMKKRFLRAEEREIKRRVNRRFEELKRNLESQMPGLVLGKLQEILKGDGWPPEIEEAIDSRATLLADRILVDTERWPGPFKAYYLEQVEHLVSEQLDSEFVNRVELEVERRLDALKAGRWKEYTFGKARELAAGLKEAAEELTGTWWFTCDRCGRRLALDIGPSEIGLLLRAETVEVACTACQDPADFPFVLSTVPHRVANVTLEDLLQVYLGEPPSKG